MMSLRRKGEGESISILCLSKELSNKRKEALYIGLR